MNNRIKFMWIMAVILLFGLASGNVGAEDKIEVKAIDRKELFSVPNFTQLPPTIQVLSEKSEKGVKLMEFYFAGAPFNGAPTKIYAFYACPEKPGKYPGVVQLHGAGLGVLSPDAAIDYARNGYACISIDWCGPAKERKEPRKPPYSEFNSPGNMAYPLPDQKGVYKTYGIDKDGIGNGVRFVRRAFMFLRSRPEVDAEKLCLSGMSMGAHLSLLVLGQEPAIKAAAVKYGEGFIRDMPGFFGGAFGPVSLCPKEEQDQWLAVFDPKQDVPNYKTSVLMLSGTDDIFFWMPVVLKTYREIPTAKRLIMLPNDNHSQVGNEVIARRYFQSVLGEAPAFPEVSAPTVRREGDKLMLTMKVNAPSKLTKVEYAFKIMPVKTFWAGSKDVPWTVQPAMERAGMWELTMPSPKEGDQLVAYGMAEDETGAKAASDTVEVPDFPKWRGLSQSSPAPTAKEIPPKQAANLFPNPSFEDSTDTAGPGKVTVGWLGKPVWDKSGARAHTGKVAAGLSGDVGLHCGAKAEAGKRYRLGGYFRSDFDGVAVRIQINWLKTGGLIRDIYETGSTRCLTEYEPHEIVATAPPETVGVTLIITGTSENDLVWMDDVFWGEVPEGNVTGKGEQKKTPGP